MLIEIRDEKEQTAYEFTGKAAKDLAHVFMSVKGEFRTAKYSSGECSQLVIDSPQKIATKFGLTLYLWKGYRINFKNE